MAPEQKAIVWMLEIKSLMMMVDYGSRGSIDHEGVYLWVCLGLVLFVK